MYVLFLYLAIRPSWHRPELGAHGHYQPRHLEPEEDGRTSDSNYHMGGQSYIYYSK